MQDKESLTRQAQHRDPEAFAQLYEAYFDKIYRYIALKIGNATEAVADEYGFGIRTMQGTKVASIVHQGSYRKADTSYGRFHGWMQRHGLKVCGPPKEVYLTDITDPAVEQRIEIRLPVSMG